MEVYKPSKITAVAFALALELNLEETQNFIGRAGYTLSHSSKFDIIEISLASIFVEELGHEMPSSTLMDLCQKQNIAYTFEAY